MPMTVGPVSRLALYGAFVAVVVVANVVTDRLGVVTVLGATATAGTWLAGLAFVARDTLHEAGGSHWVLAAILAGAVASAAFSPALALAAGIAFLISETADWAVYAPLRRRGRLRAAVASNAVGSVVDTAAFLAIAGFPLAVAPTQVAVKGGISIAAALIVGRIGALSRQPLHGGGAGSHA